MTWMKIICWRWAKTTREKTGVRRGISTSCYLRPSPEKGKVMKMRTENMKVTKGMRLS